MESCTENIRDATKGLYHKYSEGDTKDCFIFDSWFSLNISEEVAMDIGAYTVGMVYNNKKDYVRKPLGILQRTGQEFLTSS